MTDPTDISDEPNRSRFKALGDVWESGAVQRCRGFVRAVLYRVYRLLGELTAVVLGLSITLSWIAVSALDHQSSDLTLLRPNIKTWFAEAFDGRGTEFGRLDAAWLPASNQVVLTMEDAVILDKSDDVIESFELVKLTLGLAKTDNLSIRLVNAQVQGGVLSYVEDEDGQVTIGLGRPEAIGRIGPVYRSSEPLVQMSTPFANDIDYVQINDATVYVQNASSEISLTTNVDILNVSFSRSGGLVLSSTGQIQQENLPAPFSLDMILSSDFSELKMNVNVENGRLDKVGPRKGRFSDLRGVKAPVDLEANIDFSRAEGLRSASVDLTLGAGTVTNLRSPKTKTYPLDKMTVKGTLEPGEARMEIKQLTLSSPKLKFTSSGFLTELGNLSDGDPTTSPVFDLRVPNLKMDLTPSLSTTLSLERVALRGQVDMDTRSLDIFDGSLSIFQSVHNFSGGVTFDESDRPTELRLNTKMSGGLTPQQFLTLWPVKSVDGARRWIERSILDGRLTQIDAQIAFDETFFETQELTPANLNVQFRGENALVRYMSTMPPAEGVSAQGAIQGNRLDLQMNGGRVEDITLIDGRVEMPQLMPAGGDLNIWVEGQGEVVDFVRLADNKPFHLATRYGVDPFNLEGRGNVNLKVTRPLLDVFPRERILYEVKGDFVDAKAPFSIGRFNVENGVVKLEANKDRMIMSGLVDIGPWRANMEWLETFGQGALPTQYKVSGPISAVELDGLGIASRGWFDGQADVVIDAQGRGANITNANLDIDLSNAALSFEQVWMKDVNQPARLTGQLVRDSETGVSVQGMSLKGGDISIAGNLFLETDYRLQLLELSEVKISSLIDGSIKVKPDRERARLDLTIDGQWADISPWTENLFATRKSSLDVAVNLNGRIQTLVLDRDYVVDAATFSFAHNGAGIEGGRIDALSNGEALFIDMQTLPDATRTVGAQIPDASKAVRAFLGLDNTSGGELRLDMTLPAVDEVGAFVGEAQMRDFKLIEAPAMAQLLSLASLTGLSDTLLGGSMQFDRFRVPFTMLGEDISIRDARLYGPALGMTGDGDIDLSLRVLDFDGTIVPAYTANSILGDIPVLGDLFVQEKDGGLFALTYTVNGPFEQTQIAVNPLSALTPGFLRGIFKRDRSEADEELKRKIEEVQPKSNPDE